MDRPTNRFALKLRRPRFSLPVRGFSVLFFFMLWIAACLLVDARSAAAQMQDSFEGGAPRWRLVESDCNAQLTLQEISVTFPHGGQTSELIEVAANNGTFVYLAYPVEPCVVVDEFQPRLWTRCASAGLRIGVRIVFPSTQHPVTGGRLSAIVWGDTYSEPGQWQSLKLSNLQKLFQAEVVGLRQRYGPEVLVEDAFIDAVVMNAYRLRSLSDAS